MEPRAVHRAPAASAPAGAARRWARCTWNSTWANTTRNTGSACTVPGTRVLEDLAELDAFADGPWASGYLQGIVDAPFLHLTPGTRSGVIRDEAYAGFCEAMDPLEAGTGPGDRGTAAGRGGAGQPAGPAHDPQGLPGSPAGPAGGGIRLVRHPQAREGLPPGRSRPAREEVGRGEEDAAPGRRRAAAPAGQTVQKQFFEFSGPAVQRAGLARLVRGAGRTSEEPAGGGAGPVSATGGGEPRLPVGDPRGGRPPGAHARRDGHLHRPGRAGPHPGPGGRAAVRRGMRGRGVADGDRRSCCRSARTRRTTSRGCRATPTTGPPASCGGRGTTPPRT